MHALICSVRSRVRRRFVGQPFWYDDKTAKMLGVAHLGCPRCGRGAIQERDAAYEQFGEPYDPPLTVWQKTVPPWDAPHAAPAVPGPSDDATPAADTDEAGEAHWETHYDPDDGEPYGELCYCPIGDDHDATDDGADEGGQG